MGKIRLYDQNNKEVVLDDSKEISRGGEGFILEVNKSKVAKVYHSGITPITKSKFADLQNLKSSSFVKPLELLFDNKGNVKAYTMQMVPQNFFPLFSTYSQVFSNSHGVTDSIKHRICEKLVDAVKFAHNNSIVVGDLNPFNILTNDSAETYFIDVDSYQTPNDKHSGRLLDDVRDYLYHGTISNESDFFALAVIMFNMLTQIHPYKGVHRTFPGLADRMQRKITVFDNDPQLIVPKCYKPIQDKHLQDQFERIFKHGERFLINLSKTATVAVNKAKKVVSKDDLAVLDVFSGLVDFMTVSDNIFAVVSNGVLQLFDCSSKGYYKLFGKLDVQKHEKPFVTNSSAFIFNTSSGTLDQVNMKTMQRVNVKGFQASDILSFKQFENVAVVVTEDKMYKLYLDKCMNFNISIDAVSVYGRSFKKYNGMFQNIGSKSYIMYNSNGVINQVSSDYFISDVIQTGNVGVVQASVNDKVSFKRFHINGMKVEFDQASLNSMRYLALKQNQFVVQAEDDLLSFLNPTTFFPIVDIKCSLADESSQLFSTNAGILINTGDSVHILNRK